MQDFLNSKPTEQRIKVIVYIALINHLFKFFFFLTVKAIWSRRLLTYAVFTSSSTHLGVHKKTLLNSISSHASLCVTLKKKKKSVSPPTASNIIIYTWERWSNCRMITPGLNFLPNSIIEYLSRSVIFVWWFSGKNSSTGRCVCHTDQRRDSMLWALKTSPAQQIHWRNTKFSNHRC